MKKWYLPLILISFLSSAATCKTMNELANQKAMGTKYEKHLDALTKAKVDKIDEFLSDVLKTEHQLIPKLCKYIVITGISNEEFNFSKDSIVLAIKANSTVHQIDIFIDQNQEAFENIKNFLKDTNNNIHTFSNEKELFENIKKIKGDNEMLDFRRVLLLTDSKNMRKTYAKYIDVLGFNEKHLIIDNFAFLYKTTRYEYEHPSKDEIIDMYKQIECK